MAMSHLAEARSEHAEGYNLSRTNDTSRWNPFDDPSESQHGLVAGREAPRHPRWDPEGLRDVRDR